jgi:hypothetical protein
MPGRANNLLALFCLSSFVQVAAKELEIKWTEQETHQWSQQNSLRQARGTL